MKIIIVFILGFFCHQLVAQSQQTPGWTFEREGIQGVLLASMHVMPSIEEIDRKSALAYRVWLRSIIEPEQHLFLERHYSEIPSLEIKAFPKRIEPLGSEILHVIRQALPSEISLQQLETLPDWMIGLQINAARQARQSSSSIISGTELELIRIFKEYGQPVAGLEAPSRLYYSLSSLSPNAQRQFLKDGLGADDIYAYNLGVIARLFFPMIMQVCASIY